MYKVVQLLSVVFLQKEILGQRVIHSIRQRVILAERVAGDIPPGAVGRLTWGAEKMVRLQKRAIKQI